MSEKTRYTDEELQEFKELILKKLDKARGGCKYVKQGGGRTAGSAPDEVYPASAGRLGAYRE